MDGDRADQSSRDPAPRGVGLFANAKPSPERRARPESPFVGAAMGRSPVAAPVGVFERPTSPPDHRPKSAFVFSQTFEI